MAKKNKSRFYQGTAQIHPRGDYRGPFIPLNATIPGMCGRKDETLQSPIAFALAEVEAEKKRRKKLEWRARESFH